MSNSPLLRSVFPSNRQDLSILGHIAPGAILFDDVDDDHYQEVVYACSLPEEARKSDGDKSELFVHKYDIINYGRLKLKHLVVSLHYDDVLNVRSGKKQLLALCSDGYCHVVEVALHASGTEKSFNLTDKSSVSNEVHTPTSEVKQTGAYLRNDDTLVKHETLGLRLLHELRIMMNARNAICVDIDRDGHNELLISFTNVVAEIKVYRFKTMQTGANNEQQTITSTCLRTIELPSPISSRLLLFNKHSVVLAFERSDEDVLNKKINVGFIELDMKGEESRYNPTDLSSSSRSQMSTLSNCLTLRTVEFNLSSNDQQSEQIYVEDVDSRQRKHSHEQDVSNVVNHRVELTTLRRRRRVQSIATLSSTSDSRSADDSTEFSDYEHENLFAFSFGSTLVVTNTTGTVDWIRTVNLPEGATTAPASDRLAAKAVSNLFCLSTLRLDSNNRSANVAKSFRLHWNSDEEEDYICVATWRGDVVLVDGFGRFATRIQFPDRCCASHCGIFASPPNANTFLVRAVARRSRASSGKADFDESLFNGLQVSLSNRPAIAFVTFENRLILHFNIIMPQKLAYSQSVIQRIRNGFTDVELLDKAKADAEQDRSSETKQQSNFLQNWIGSTLYTRAPSRVSERNEAPAQ